MCGLRLSFHGLPLFREFVSTNFALLSHKSGLLNLMRRCHGHVLGSLDCKPHLTGQGRSSSRVESRQAGAGVTIAVFRPASPPISPTPDTLLSAVIASKADGLICVPTFLEVCYLVPLMCSKFTSLPRHGHAIRRICLSFGG